MASLDSDKDKAAWAAFLDPANPSPETTAPLGWLSGAAPAPHRTALLQAILVRVFRPERVLAALELFVSAVFGADFGWRALGSSLDLADALLDTRPATPILLCSEAGQDASAKVDALASTQSTGGVQTLLQVSMGSHEGYAEADKSIALAAKARGWVLLRNVHLCPDWLGLLEKRLSSPGFAASAHEGFRLFLTSEMSPALPAHCYVPARCSSPRPRRASRPTCSASWPPFPHRPRAWQRRHARARARAGSAGRLTDLHLHDCRPAIAPRHRPSPKCPSACTSRTLLALDDFKRTRCG